MADVRSVITEMIRWQPQVRAKDRGADLCDKFFGCQRMRAEPLGHIASNAMRAKAMLAPI